MDWILVSDKTASRAREIFLYKDNLFYKIMSQNENEFKCSQCENIYKTKNGLQKHVRTIHPITNNVKEEKQHTCKFCYKNFRTRQTKWSHEQKCKTINEIPLAEEVKILKAEIKELKAKPSNIINNTTNNTTNNIQIIMKQPGTESIEHLSTDKQREIMQKGLNSLTYLIEKTNFDKLKPENHTYCVTALNDKHASVINSETNTITKIDKNTLFDMLLVPNLANLEKMTKNPNFNQTERKEYEEKIKKLKNLLLTDKKCVKRYYQELNLLSYNNKDMVMDTWASLETLNKIIEPENMINDNPVLNNKKLEFNEPDKKNKIVPDMYLDDSGSELSNSDNSDDSDTEEVELTELKIKNITYIIEGNKLYQKTDLGKGEYYGTYSNGASIAKAIATALRCKAKKATKHINL